LGELHRKTARAEIVPKLLPKQHFDVGLVINHKDQQVHHSAPDWQRR
jgi:hypothetical protein